MRLRPRRSHPQITQITQIGSDEERGPRREFAVTGLQFAVNDQATSANDHSMGKSRMTKDHELETKNHKPHLAVQVTRFIKMNPRPSRGLSGLEFLGVG